MTCYVEVWAAGPQLSWPQKSDERSFQSDSVQVMEVYQPGAVVVCGGADSLSGDRLGCFNLSLQGHSNCVEFLAKFNVPMLVLGGGGYTMRNVARCWCYETGRMLGMDLPDTLPNGVMLSNLTNPAAGLSS